MILSQACNYGILAMFYIAKESREGKYMSIRTVSSELNISFAFLTKILQQLTHAGMLSSVRGAKGGVALARPAEDIRLYDIVKAIDGDALFHECMLGLPGCGEQKPCPMHETWSVLRSKLKKSFMEHDLADASVDIEALGLRLSL